MTTEKRLEAEIDALLAHDDTASVVDTLLAIPRLSPADGQDGAWEKLLHARLQARLTKKMQETIGEKPRRQGSRNAA